MIKGVTSLLLYACIVRTTKTLLPYLHFFTVSDHCRNAENLWEFRSDGGLSLQTFDTVQFCKTFVSAYKRTRCSATESCHMTNIGHEGLRPNIFTEFL